MNDRDRQPFNFTSQMVRELLDNDWELGVLSGTGDASFDALRAGRWTAQDLNRIRSMDFVPGWQHDNRSRHRFTLHAWDGLLDHTQETREDAGWRLEYNRTLAAFCTRDEWAGESTINPGAYHVRNKHPDWQQAPRQLVFEPYQLSRVEHLIRDALIDTRTDRLRDLDW